MSTTEKVEKTQRIRKIRKMLNTDWRSVQAIWNGKVAEPVADNCWKAAMTDRSLVKLAGVQWRWRIAVDEKDVVCGFIYWLHGDNPTVHAIAADIEQTYLQLVDAVLAESKDHAWGYLISNRPECEYFRNIGAKLVPVGFAPINEKRFAKRSDTLTARRVKRYRVIVPVSCRKAIGTRLKELS